MSLVRQFIDRLYNRSNTYTQITFAGLDHSGKTTLLYRLKLDTLINAYPTTIGSNCETFKSPVTVGNRAITKEAPLEIVGWDFGMGCGMGYMNAMLRMFTAHGDGLVWVVDGNDSKRLQESADELEDTLKIIGNETNEIPVLVLVNKQDLPGVRPLSEIHKAFSKVLAGRISAFFPTSAIRSISESGLPKAFDWLQVAMQICRERAKVAKNPVDNTPAPVETKQTVVGQQTSVRTPGNLAQKLESWLSRIEGDSSLEEFLTQFENIALPNWDHYTHIRLAFHNLKIHGRRKGKDVLFKGIEKYIAESSGSQTTGKAFHVTMTYFWIQIVHFGILNIQGSDETADEDWTDEFGRFLIINPYVVDGQLWTDYYTKDVMMGQEAKTGMVLPDKKPLPSVAIRDQVNKLT